MPHPKGTEPAYPNLFVTPMVRLTVMKFGVITYAGSGMFLRVPISREKGPSIPKFFGTLPMPKHFDLERIWHDNTCRVAACFYGISHTLITRGGAPASPKFLGPPICMHTV